MPLLERPPTDATLPVYPGGDVRILGCGDPYWVGERGRVEASWLALDGTRLVRLETDDGTVLELLADRVEAL